MPAHNHNDGVYNVLLKYDAKDTTNGINEIMLPNKPEPNLVNIGFIQSQGGN